MEVGNLLLLTLISKTKFPLRAEEEWPRHLMAQHGRSVRCLGRVVHAAHPLFFCRDGNRADAEQERRLPSMSKFSTFNRHGPAVLSIIASA